jgi:hypothetical protein
MGGHNNQPIVGVNGGGGRLKGDATGAERVGGGLSLRSGRRIERQKIENKRGGDQALGGRQSIKKRHNQPYDSVGGGGLFEMRRYCGGTYGGDDITSFGRRINRRKLMKEKNTSWP